MNLYGEISGSEIIFVEQDFISDDEAYNLYNAYARNKRFGVRKKRNR